MADQFEFQLFDHYPHELPVVYEQIRAGNVPFDALFRLAAIGCEEVDPLNERKLLQWQLLQDVGRNGDDRAALREDTHEILYGELPDLVVDFWNHTNRDGYPELETMYYTLGDMVRAVMESREERGVVVYNPILDKPYYSDEEKLRLTSIGDARKIWRILVRRVNPDVIDHPERYCPPTTSFDFNNVYYLSERTMIRRNIANSVMSDSAILRIYEESVETGVKGIARVGQEILRLLLVEEHPELHEGFFCRTI